MNRRRLDKVAEEVRREISGILREEVKDPRLDDVTVTRVEVSNDLSHAVVYVSVIGGEERQEEVTQALARARGFVRSELARRIRLRHALEINLVIDRSIEHGIRIAAVLNQIKAQENGIEPK